MNISKTDQALYVAEDLLIRVGVPFFVMGQTAKEMHDNPDGEISEPICLGIKRAELIDSRLSMLKTMLPPEAAFKDNKVTFQSEGVPVVIRIIDKHYKVLENLQHAFYKIATFDIPNPFDTYWKQRNFIQ